MTYIQVQSFQINDFANHYMDIKITGYRMLYSESIAGKGIARLIGWVQQGRLTALIEYLRSILIFFNFVGKVHTPLAIPLK